MNTTQLIHLPCLHPNRYDVTRVKVYIFIPFKQDKTRLTSCKLQRKHDPTRLWDKTSRNENNFSSQFHPMLLRQF